MGCKKGKGPSREQRIRQNHPAEREPQDVITRRKRKKRLRKDERTAARTVAHTMAAQAAEAARVHTEITTKYIKRPTQAQETQETAHPAEA